MYYEPRHEQFGATLHFVFAFAWTDDREPHPASDEIEAVGFWPIDALPRPMTDFTERRILDARRGEAVVATIHARAWLD